jgi:hypothetical protein
VLKPNEKILWLRVLLGNGHVCHGPHLRLQRVDAGVTVPIDVDAGPSERAPGYGDKFGGRY